MVKRISKGQYKTLEDYFNSAAKGYFLAILPSQAFVEGELLIRIMYGLSLISLSLLFLALALFCSRGMDYGYNKRKRSYRN